MKEKQTIPPVISSDHHLPPPKRELLRETQTLHRYEPSGDYAAWAAVEDAVYGRGSP